MQESLKRFKSTASELLWGGWINFWLMIIPKRVMTYILKEFTKINT